MQITEQDITALLFRCNHYSAAISGLTLTALGHFSTRDNTVLPLRRSLLWWNGPWINILSHLLKKTS